MPSRTYAEVVAEINAGQKIYNDRTSQWITRVEDLPTEDEWNTARTEDLTRLVGAQGAPGATIRSGSGVPANEVGIDGDFYIRTSNGDLYHRAADAYTVVGNIKGPTGATGATGAAGSTPTLTSLLAGLPTTDPAIAGRPWLNAGVLTVSAG